MAYKGKYNGKQLEDTLDAVAGKQNTIEDLVTIRSGAALGATSVQPTDLATMQATVSAAIASFEERLPQANEE